MVIPSTAYILIIGAMKSGTSTLYGLLQQHPEICSCLRKESEFFSEKLGHPLPVSVYQDLWEFDSDVHQFVIEASTGYTKEPFETGVAERIYAAGIRPLFIYVVRDPLARIESDYNFSRDKKWFDPTVSITSDRYTTISMYHSQLRDYTALFGRENILIIDFDDLCRTPQNVLGMIYERTGLKTVLPENCFEVGNKTVQKVRFLYPLTRHKLYRSIGATFPTPVRHFETLAGKIFPPQQKRKLSSREAEIVKVKIESDIRLFGKEYNFPVEKWRLF